MNNRRILRRLLLALPTVFGVGVIVFVLLRVVPGNPIAMMTPPGATAQDIEQLKALYGFDKSIFHQLIIWGKNILSGDLGTSISLRQNVATLIADRLPATLELVFVASLIGSVLCLTMSLIAVYLNGTIVSALLNAIASLTQAVPDFLWGLLLILALGVLWPVLPISGRFDPRSTHEFVSQFYLFESLFTLNWSVLTELLSRMIMPALALALPLTGIVTRVLKASLEEVMQQDFILMARARGHSRLRILWAEALRNAMIPTLTLGGVQLTFLIGGTVLIERLFSYPGIGNMAIGAVIDRDLPLIQGLVLTFAIIFIVINLLVDLSYSWLNPRVRQNV